MGPPLLGGEEGWNVRNRLTILSLLSSSLPLVLPLSNNRSSKISSEVLKKSTKLDLQTDSSNLSAWSILRGKPSIRNRPKPLDHPGAEGGEDKVSVMAFSSSCDGMLTGDVRMFFFFLTCLDGNLHRDDFALCNILGDHRTVPGSFTGPLCSKKITSCFPPNNSISKAHYQMQGKCRENAKCDMD